MAGRQSPKRSTTSTLEVIRAYFRHCGPGRRLIPVLLILLFADAMLQAAVPALMGYIVDGVVRDAHAFVTQQLPWLVPVAVTATLLFYGIAYSQHYLTQHIGQSVGTRFQVELYNHLQRLSADFYQRTQVGEITSRLTNDINQGVTPLFAQFTVSFWALSVLVLSCITMAYLSMPLLVAFLAMSLLMAAITRLVSGRIQHLTREVRDESGRINARMTETIYANPLIRAFAKERAFTESVSRHSALLLEKSLRTARVTVLFSDVMNTFLVLFAPTTLLLVGAYYVGQGFTVGTLVAAYGYWKTASGPISAILNNITTLFTSFASMDRIFEFFNETPTVQDRPDAKALQVAEGKIELREVAFHYPSDPDSTVLHHLSFTVPARKSLALVGESGAGKSTISQLLLRFYDPAAGVILIDGQDLRGVTQESLREQIGFVMQETILLSGTIRDNLLLARPDAGYAEMVEALRSAGAWEFVQRLPQGLDTMLGERGARLSTGQKQRLSIARVFLKNPPIVIFDEATSALDAVTEKGIQQAMTRLLHDRTAIIIAHRLSTVIDCDEILFLAQGRILAHGTHAELLATCPPYFELCEKQLIVRAA